MKAKISENQDKMTVKVKLVAVDSSSGCRGCYFTSDGKCFGNNCHPEVRGDGRNIIWVMKD